MEELICIYTLKSLTLNHIIIDIPYYAISGYIGMKAYKTIKDSSDLRLFRPELNMKRLKDSMTRLSMPGADFDSQELINCIGKLVRVDEDFIPEGEGYSLYLRPTVIATHPFLGLSPPDDLLLYVSSRELSLLFLLFISCMQELTLVAPLTYRLLHRLWDLTMPLALILYVSLLILHMSELGLGAVVHQKSVETMDQQ